MSLVNLDSVPKSTRIVLQHLSNVVESRHFILAGGTGLSLQIDHRISEDIDLFSLSDALDTKTTQNLINSISRLFTVNVIPHDPATVVEFSDSGLDLDRLHKDYTITTDHGPVKLTLSVPENNFDILNRLENIKLGHLSIAPVETIFDLKSQVLTVRHKKRDLFDLATLLESGVGDMERIINTAINKSSRHYINILENKMTTWPLKDGDSINFRNKIVDDMNVRDSTLQILSEHLALYEKRKTLNNKSIIEQVTKFRGAIKGDSNLKP